MAAVAVVAGLTLVAGCTSGSRSASGSAATIGAPIVGASTRGQSADVSACASLTSGRALLLAGAAGAGLDPRHGFDCAGDWAYVNYVRPKPNTNEATADLRFVNGVWIVADRTLACGDGTRAAVMPASLVQWGCGN